MTKNELTPDQDPANYTEQQPRNWLKITLIIFIIAMVSVLGIVAYVAADLPVWDPAQLSGANATLLYDDEGNLVTRLHAEENRTNVSYDRIPPAIVDAFIATEDKDFYEHHGINIKGIARAIVHNIKTRNLTSQGASTITQQLARHSFLTLDKKWERKIKEILLAFKIESEYSKEEILNMYLNKIYFGSGAYGVQAAANTYFGKDVSELTLGESAMLAGLAQSPEGYNPFQNYDAAKHRQYVVLNNMVNCGMISQQECEEAYNQEISLVKGSTGHGKYGYFVDAVIDEALSILPEVKGYENTEYAVYRAGFKIYTTMDADLQSYAEEFFKNPANFPAQTYGDEVIQAAIVVVNHHTGEVKTLIGGRQYEQQRGFNRATHAFRQPGSTIKPLTVYAPALENGIMPYTVYNDAPLAIKTESGIWRPENYDGQYRGPITMRTAIQWSSNTYAVQCLDTLGVRTGYDFGKALGLSLIDSPGKNDLSLAPLSLGGLTKGTNALQMASAYGAFGNGGYYIKPYLIKRIEASDGTVLYEHQSVNRKVMRQDTAWLMSNLLQTVVQAGTGSSAQIPGVPTCGKTGTSEEYRDSWFCGLTPQFSAAVWMGFDRHHTMHNVYGGGFPARMFRAIMQEAHKDVPAGSFPMPASIVRTSICSKSGKIPGELCSSDDIVTEYVRRDCLPQGRCDAHELLVICTESGKLAGSFCPHTEGRVFTKTGTGSEKIPTETCDLHTEMNIPDIPDIIIDRVKDIVPEPGKDMKPRKDLKSGN
ncbi:MAG TPA: PBP1A family penicillin-binding protein [Syntrophomonadaceae bacterium]|nr:PBP1A family penicillin-binding protein [Syntrophomonadaceae bacterium]